MCDGGLCHVAGARHGDHVTQAARPAARALAQAQAQNPEEAALFYLAEHQTSCALPHVLSWCRPKSSRRSLPPVQHWHGLRSHSRLTLCCCHAFLLRTKVCPTLRSARRARSCLPLDCLSRPPCGGCVGPSACWEAESGAARAGPSNQQLCCEVVYGDWHQYSGAPCLRKMCGKCVNP